MSSSRPGKSISTVEVTNISSHGLWIFLGEREYFLSFESFPWFRDQPVAAIFNLVELSPGHVYWPDIDVDLSLEIIEHPERFPLVARRQKDGKRARLGREKIE